MKLSEMETERAFDVACEILPSVQAIAQDEGLQAHFSAMAKKSLEDLDTFAKKIIFCMDNVSALTLTVLKRHKNDVFTILAAMEDKDIEDIKRQKITDTIKEIKELVKDPELMELFKSQGRTGDATSSGSASESTVKN